MLSPSFTADGSSNAANHSHTGCLNDVCTLGGLPLLGDKRYRLTTHDVFHRMLLFAVFMAVAMVDRNLVACFYPMELVSMRHLMVDTPMAAGAAGSFLFAMFPSTHRGIGSPMGSS
nr:unnamed protein product [Digitaria exilis]